MIVVPVVSPVSARELAGLAARIAAPEGGRVLPVSVLRIGSTEEARQRAQALVDDAAAAARGHGAAAEGIVRSDSSVVHGVLACMSETAASLAVMGWQGASTQRNVFGELIDSIVGRSTIPLAVVRTSAVAYGRVVLPVSEDHLLPGGARGLQLAAELARRLQQPIDGMVTILRTGAGGTPLPPEVQSLGDRIHHDRRRVDLAVGSAAGQGDLVVAPVAPTASGLRTATTHMAWAAPDAWLVVAIDVGPPPPHGRIADAVAGAGSVPDAGPDDDGFEEHQIEVTARVGDDTGPISGLMEALRRVGTVGPLVEGPPDEEGRRCWRISVTVQAPTVNVAVGAVMTEVHESESLQGAEITYDVATSRPSGA